MFAGEAYDKPSLYLRNPDWKPDPSLIPSEITTRISQFINLLRAEYQRTPRRTVHNLLPHQAGLLKQFHKSDEFIVLPSDKNLGPAILERTECMHRVFQDHLEDRDTYEIIVP